ncbi:MAG: hypothetical protein KJ847_03260 [Firmicutes bacterium]|nr:hypothetical protein [Bacillota bacterium]
MKIDLHCHTIATKSGEAKSRNVDRETFLSKINDNQVDIVAITNHNKFDLVQYTAFINDKFQVWPGVELDVKGTSSTGHCILISDPEISDKFDTLVKSITGDCKPSDFVIEVETLCERIKDYKLIIIAHYGNKKPSLSDEDIDLLRSRLSTESAFFLEPQNLRSAGIYCAHDKNSLVGSDHHDWSTYPGSDCQLPELKLPIENYNKFFLLMKKDPIVIKTFLEKKLYGKVEIQPFFDCKLNIDIFYDINVVFGGKGTGKTEILRAIEKNFERAGSSDVAKYFASDKQLTFTQMTSVEVGKNDFASFSIDDCSESFKSLKEWNEKTVTATKQYFDWCTTKDTELLKKNFGFINSVFNELIDSTKYNKSFELFNKHSKNIDDIINENFTEFLSIEDEQQLKEDLVKLKDSIREQVICNFCELKALDLEKFTIDKMKLIFKSKKGIEAKPSGTGLLQQYENCIMVYNHSSKIINALETSPKYSYTLLGRLLDKGNIYLKKTIQLNPENANAKYTFKLGKSKLQTLRNLKNLIASIKKDSFSYKMKESISNYNSLANVETILSVEDFVGVHGETVKSDKTSSYGPSNGEQSMLVLNYALLDDKKKFFILDEPEMSVGHKYINQVIVPRLKELARLGKIVVVSTHDANIAIRTLPFQSIYREDLGEGKYTTYIGNPFLELMQNYDNHELSINWAKTSIDTLEGGKEAFNERGEAYGKEII